MSFETQETGSSCGPASLRYALCLLGIAVSEQEIRELIGNRWWHAVRGYGEKHLELAANKLGLTARTRTWRNNPEACLNAMKAAAARGNVCIASVHDDDDSHFHWMCVAGFEGATKAVVLDPSMFDTRLGSSTFRLLDPAGERVPALMAVSRLKAWLTPTKPGDGQFFLELSAGARRFRWHAELTRVMSKHEHFLEHYDEYVDEMRGVFGAKRGEFATAFIESIRGELLIPTRSLAERRLINLELDAWEAVCRAYGLRIEASKQRQALTTLSDLLGRRAVGA